MIELLNVSKTYKSKKSKNTKALDNVSITFDNKGITFILGKSGSGKSTLLNIIGGLDKYDSGDMIILGKSSKDFTQTDFDSYRNTYVGFIFQEFNILEDYDVYENIVLALQLQKKEVNESEVDELLDRLELKELKKRKVNELSGGQKQRVAIARALIKNPKIILADEPTGNLDSKTGNQVMELLKEIAKEKLVVIVSHDEEYAKTYGDRIIEIKDGQIINDTKEVKKSNTNQNTYKTIKSYLPFKDGFKLGAGSLKHKKVKLLFTIFLTVATLGFLSCADTLSSYKFSVGHAKYVSEKKEQFIQIEKKHIFKDKYGHNNITLLSMDDESIKKIKNKINKESYDVYKYNDTYDGEAVSIGRILHIENDTSYDPAEIVVTTDISKIIKENVKGRMPSASNEIVISNHVANQIIKNGVEVHEYVVKNEFKQSKIFKPNTFDEILNSKYNYYFGNKTKVKIVGIIDYNLNKSDREYKNNVLNKIYVSPNFIKDFKQDELITLTSSLQAQVIVEGISVNKNNQIGAYRESTILNHQVEYFDGTKWKKTSSLNDNEVILHVDQIANGYNYHEDLNNYINRSNGDYAVLTKKFMANYIKEKNLIGKKADLKLYYDSYEGDLLKEFKDFTIIGVYYDDMHCNNGQNGNDCINYSVNYFSKNILGEYIQKQLDRTSILYPMTNRSDFKKTTDMFPVESELAIKSTYSEKLYDEKLVLDSIKKLAFYASLVFLVFTIFLIINFMLTSISYRKKEIGVLRALGSRSRDVMKIFLWEGVVLSLISGTIASILLVIVSDVMNSFIMNTTGMLTTPFIVGIRQFVVIYFLVFAVTIISSILPIFRISKMKPIDAILNK